MSLSLLLKEIIYLRNHHRARGLCEQTKHSLRASARGLGCLLTKPEGKVMVPILTWLLNKYIYILKSCKIIIFLFSNAEAAIFNFGTLQQQKEENLPNPDLQVWVRSNPDLQVWVGSKEGIWVGSDNKHWKIVVWDIRDCPVVLESLAMVGANFTVCTKKELSSCD